MKKILLIGAMCALMFACNDADINEGTNHEADEMVEVAVTFGDAGLDVATRGFLEDVLETQPWESRVNNMNIHVFKADNIRVVNQNLTPSEVAAGRVIIKMPRSATEQQCTFYATVNNGNIATTITQEARFIDDSHSNVGISSLNSGYASSVISGSYSTNRNFPMSGSAKAHVSPYGYFTDVHIPLTRYVAKIAFMWQIDPDFSINHNGATIEITSVVLTPTPNYTYSFEVGEPRQYKSTAQTLPQIPLAENGWQCNLWYSYECNDASDPISIILTGIYDKDGDPATTDDRHEVSYSIPVDYVTGKGIIKRNNIYRISAVIKGLAANNLAATWEVYDWVDGHPINNNELGM